MGNKPHQINVLVNFEHKNDRKNTWLLHSSLGQQIHAILLFQPASSVNIYDFSTIFA
jgi:hypothetical protein